MHTQKSVLSEMCGGGGLQTVTYAHKKDKKSTMDKKINCSVIFHNPGPEKVEPGLGDASALVVVPC